MLSKRKERTGERGRKEVVMKDDVEDCMCGRKEWGRWWWCDGGDEESDRRGDGKRVMCVRRE